MNTQIWNLNENWKFSLGSCEDAWYKGYDDSSWSSVMLPHDWSVGLPFSRENSSGTGYLAGGCGWYRLRFSIPEEYRGKAVKVVFDGVYKNSQVWCNSVYCGKRPNGYTSFSYNLSSIAGFGDLDNVICVKVTHNDLADSRWFTGSGITRKVSLVIEEPVHPVEYGCIFKCISSGQEEAEVEIIQEIVNADIQSREISVTARLSDQEGREALSVKGEIILKAGEEGKLVFREKVENPKLWSMESPNLYNMQTWYSVDGGEEYLADENAVGIRSFFFDPEKGFFLNGEAKKLKGVCVHHDGGCLGAAMEPEVWQRRLEVLKECGCNAIRCSHNPHMPQLYELCDRMGFVMMDEAFDEWENAKNKWWQGHNVYPPRHQGYFEEFPQWHEADLRAMVKRDRNHPSVILWSIGNEIDYPNDPYCHPMFDNMTGNNDANKPEAERAFDSNKPNAERLAVLAKRLADIVRSEDDSRPVTLAAAFPELSSRLGFLDCLDVAGYNYKEHLYDEDHKRFPFLPLLGSENGHSYQAWLSVRDNPYISGQFLWTGIDYLGEAHGWPVHGSPAGIINCGGFPKPEFYRRKSFWCQEPEAHLGTRKADGRTQDWIPVSESWNYEQGDHVLVKCFSNLPQAVLYLNGREIGRLKEANGDGAFGFTVEYEPGVLEVRMLDNRGLDAAGARLETAGRAERLDCNIWQHGDVLSGKNWMEASACTGYLYQLELGLTDLEGRRTVRDDRPVIVTVSGAGELAGLENGDLSDVTPYCQNMRRTYQGRLISFIRRTGCGKIRVNIYTEFEAGKVYEGEVELD